MHRLRRLSLSGNPVGRITNDSFVGLKHLEELDISGIQAESFQVGEIKQNYENGANAPPVFSQPSISA